MITVFGLRNCDTCRKALKWLEGQGIEHRFHDFRKDGLDAGALDRWIAEAGWETVLNRRSTTWRKLPDAAKDGLDGAKAAALMAAHPALIKRPVFEAGGRVVIGFKDQQQRQLAEAG